jgi:hypothetical protein
MIQLCRTTIDQSAWHAIAMGVVASFIAGCGGRSDLGSVSGQVTVAGQPASGIEVRFDPQGPGRGSVGYTDSDGVYELQLTSTVDGAILGKHNVAVFDRSGKIKIPSEFARMEFEVRSGSNEFDIDIPAQ